MTKTFSSDGTYMLLTGDGTVHLSGGDLDNSGRTRAFPLILDTAGGDVVTDLNVWGHRLGGNYYGGGYVLTSEPGC